MTTKTIEASAPVPRTKRMRARRLRVEDLKLGILQVACRHAKLGPIEGAAEDVSMHGLSVLLGAPSELRALLLGDRLEDVRITCEAGLLYDGQAQVRRITDRGEAL
ncbi:MAG: hypothetical protein H6Q90_1564, partial [Deltaproteobacteria bacterium]|nr:hypothetical protein [Deltaproteobacteria bacterium]